MTSYKNIGMGKQVQWRGSEKLVNRQSETNHISTDPQHVPHCPAVPNAGCDGLPHSKQCNHNSIVHKSNNIIMIIDLQGWLPNGMCSQVRYLYTLTAMNSINSF